MGASTVIPKYDSDIPRRHVFEWFFQLSRLFFPGNMESFHRWHPCKKSAAPTTNFWCPFLQVEQQSEQNKTAKGLRKTQDAGLEDFRRRFSTPEFWNMSPKKEGAISKWKFLVYQNHHFSEDVSVFRGPQHLCCGRVLDELKNQNSWTSNLEKWQVYRLLKNSER